MLNLITLHVIPQDAAYHHFTQHGQYPYPSRPLVFSDRHIWFLRFNQLLWVLLVCVLPGCWLWWQILVAGLMKWAVFAVVGFIGGELAVNKCDHTPSYHLPLPPFLFHQ